MQQNLPPFDCELMRQAYAWAQAAVPAPPPEEHYCPTRDVLQARVDRARRDLMRTGAEDSDSALFHAVLMEIGGNVFDHNLGNWPDVPGALFACEIRDGAVRAAIADRGRGIHATLKRIRPSIGSDREALNIALMEVLSGRSPEHRGNGLKFVRRIVQKKKGTSLLLQSGNALYRMGNGKERFEETARPVRGVVASVEWQWQ